MSVPSPNVDAPRRKIVDIFCGPNLAGSVSESSFVLCIESQLL